MCIRDSYNTLLIAFLSALIATVIGTAAAIGINSLNKVPRAIFMGINNLPVLNSDIVTGISLMLMFIAFGVSLGFKTILLAHITFNIPYVILSVMPRLKQTNRYTYEAAMDLGAGPMQAFFRVVFPDIMPGVLSGFLMAFTMSLDDFIITHFTKGAGINTLSTLIYSEVRRGIKPSMYALSTIIFVTVLALLIITNFAPAGAQENGGSGAKAKTGNGYVAPKNTGARKFILAAASFLIVAAVSFTTYSRYAGGGSRELYVYNWGEYIDESVIDLFEEETGIHVTYDPVSYTHLDVYKRQLVPLASLRGKPALPRFPPVQKALDVPLAKRKPRRTAVQYDAYALAVGLPPGGHPENGSQ